MKPTPRVMPEDMADHLIEERYIRLTSLEYAINCRYSDNEPDQTTLARAVRFAKYITDGETPNMATPHPLDSARTN